MSKASAAAEPSMEEILASIRRIIADGDGASAAPAAKTEPAKTEPAKTEPVKAAPAKAELAKPEPAKPASPKATPAPAAKSSAPASQDDIDAMMAAMDDDEDDQIAAPEMAEMKVEDEEDALDLAMVRAAVDVTKKAAPEKPAAKAMPMIEVEEDIDFEEHAEEHVEEHVEEKPVAPVMVPMTMAKVASAPAMEVPANALLSQAAEASVAAAFGSLTQAIFSNEPRTIEDVMKELLRPMIKTWLDDNLPSVVERLVREEISRVARGKR